MAVVAKIVKIDAPASAPVGGTVVVDVHVKNISTKAYNIKATGTADGIAISWQFDYLNVLAQETVVFKGWFTFPGGTVTVYLKTWYHDGTKWVVDDVVGEEPPTETPSASIVSKVLEYGDMKVSIPVSNVPQGTSAKMRVTVRNNMTTSQKLGIGWAVVDPGGAVIQSYSDWETFTTGAGNTHEFVGPTFLIEKVGTYRTRINVFVYPSTTYVDEYYNVLCTVVLQTIPSKLGGVSVNVVYRDDYSIGDSVPYNLKYKYQGEAQSGTLQIQIGTFPWGVFSPEVTLDPETFSFARSEDYVEKSLSRSFKIPATVRLGQSYGIRLILTTADGLSDNDINYSAFKVYDPATLKTELKNLDFGVAPYNVNLGGSFVISASYQYQGNAQGGKATVMLRTFASTAYVYDVMPITFEHSDTLVTRNIEFTMPVPTILEPGQVYSVKLILETDDGKKVEKEKGSQIKVPPEDTPVDPGIGQYRLIKDHIYPLGETYRGNASEATAEFTVAIAQLPGTDWISEQVVNAFESSVKEYGSEMLRLTVYERDEGLLSKGYKVVAVATPPTGTAGQMYTPQGIVDLAYVSPQLTAGVWALIIIAALALVAIIISMLEPKVRDVVWGEGGVVETIPDILKMVPALMAVMMLGMVMPMMEKV